MRINRYACLAAAPALSAALFLTSCTDAPRKSSPAPAAPIAATPPSPPHAKHVGSTLGISYERVVGHLGDLMEIRQDSPVDGMDRYVGRTRDGLAMLEVIGDRDDVSEASLILNIPNDDLGAAMRDGGFFDIFSRNIDPKWNDAAAWITNNLNRMSGSQTDSVEMVRGERLFTLHLMRPVGMVSFSVRHRGRKDARTGRANP